MPTPSTTLLIRDDAADVSVRLAIAGFLAGCTNPTRASYATDLRIFTVWCHDHRLDRVVQVVDFVSDDPAFAGAMTWVVHAVGSGTLVEFIAENVPVGVSAEDLIAGMASSLENLDRYLET